MLFAAATLVHNIAAWSIAGLVALHVAGALKHHVVDRDDVLTRRLPGWRPAAAWQMMVYAIGQEGRPANDGKSRRERHDGVPSVLKRGRRSERRAKPLSRFAFKVLLTALRSP